MSLAVLKRDGRREPFDQHKLLEGLLRAATKRPVKLEALERLSEQIAETVRRSGGELSAERIGELALQGLIALDRVAAIRFASVYRNFEDIGEFEAELRRLETQSATPGTRLSDSSASMDSSTSTGMPPARTHSFG